MAEGPKSSRGCTDILFVLVLLAGWTGFIGLFAVGVEHADWSHLAEWTHGRDYGGNLCGRDAAASWPATFWALNGTHVLPVCAAKCCTADSCSHDAGTLDCPPYASTVCASKSTEQIGHFCVPSDYSVYGDEAAAAKKMVGIALDAVATLAANCLEVWHNLGWVMLCFFAAMLAGMFFLVILRCCAGVFVWLTILLSVALFAGVGFFALKDTQKLSQEYGLSTKEVQIIGTISLLLGFFELMVAVCCCKAIRVAVAVLKTTSEFLQESKGTMLQTIPFACLHLALYAAAIAVLAVIAAARPPDAQPDPTNPFSNYGGYAVAYTCFFVLWQNGFISALSQFAVAHAAGAWYFAPYNGLGDKLIRHSLAVQGVGVGLWYHAGSLTFGSLIVGICAFFKMMFFWAKERDTELRNPVTRCLIGVSHCALACVEKVLKFVTKVAYIQVALLGTNFCHSAKVAVGITIRHPVKVFVVSRVSNVLRFVGCIFCMAAGSVSIWAVLEGPLAGSITSPVGPWVVVTVGSLLIGQCMMHPFSQAAMAVLHCYVADSEMSEADGYNMPRHTPPAFHKFVEDHCCER